jgi:uncharacterized protein (TIGR03437 family)
MKRFSIAMPIVWGILFCSPCPAYSQGIINTVAGGPWTFPSGVSALNAPLGEPYGVSVDAQGNFYVADAVNGMVFQVTPQGALRIIAGNGNLSASGDGGPATSASLYPIATAVDASGNVYIVDSVNNRIRKVAPSGIITTVAGNGSRGYAGDGGSATSAELCNPQGVAVDTSGNLYIADYRNARVRRVAVASGVISTVAGSATASSLGDGGPATSAELQSPVAVAVDGPGNLYIADSSENRIRKVSPSGVITTVAGNGSTILPGSGTIGDGGLATSAAVGGPSGLAVDGSGNLYISQFSLNSVRKVSAGSGIINTIAGGNGAAFSGDGGPATSASLYFPQGIGVDAVGNLYIADLQNRRIRKVLNGTITTVAGNGNFRFSGDGGPALSAAMWSPSAVAVDGRGNLFIADLLNNQVRKVSSGLMSTVAGTTNWSYGASGDGGPATSASLNFPEGVAIDSSGNLFIADFGNGRTQKVVPSGIVSTVDSSGGSGVALDASGNLYVSSLQELGEVQEVTPGGVTTIAGGGFAAGPAYGDGGPAIQAKLSSPTGVALDAAGNLFIVDQSHDRIRKVSTNGVITAVASNGTTGFSGDGGPATSATLNFMPGVPAGLAVDKLGNLLFSDSGNNRIRKVSTSGIISTVAGNGTYGYSGDGGPATLASLVSPAGIAFDATGDLFIADSGNGVVREILAVSNPSVPAVSPNGIVNGASFGSQIVAPGEIVSVFGSNLGPTPGQGTSVSGGFLEASHAGVAVAFNGTPAALFYVGSTQINLQVPWEVGTATSTSVLVTAAGQTSAPYALSLRPIDPAVFISGGRMAILDQTGAQITPSYPASAGAVLSMYATGLGAVSPAVQSGQIAPNGLTPTVAKTTVSVGGVNAPVGYAGLAPGFVGLYQVNFTVPSGLPSGDQSLVMTVGGIAMAPLPLAVH